MKLAPNHPCPCGTGTKYKRCCRPLHAGQPAADPEALMRSRYSAYAGGLVDYVIRTTDPAGPAAESNAVAWTAAVRAFCAQTEFVGLTVLDASHSGDSGQVHFRAELRQAGADAGFTESSQFVRRDGRWLYHAGESDAGASGSGRSNG